MSIEVVELVKQRSSVVAIRCRPELMASIEAAAAREGLSKADICRRAVLSDLARANGNGHG